MSSKTASVVPKYRHHKGSGQAFVQVNGHRHYLGKWNAQAARNAMLPSLPSWPSIPSACRSSANVSSQCGRVDRSLPGFRARATTPRGASRQAPLKVFGGSLRPLRQLYGHDPGQRLRPGGTEGGQSRLCWNQGQRPAPRSTSGIDIIRSVFKWGVAEEIIAPARLLRPYRPSPASKRSHRGPRAYARSPGGR